jgi:hypothetical protein
VYFITGIALGALAAQAQSPSARVGWRLTAWLVSAIAFGSHVWYERLSLSSTSARAALRAALAAGLGAFGLAAAAAIHAQGTTHHFPATALAIWPIITMLPAFAAALAFAEFLSFVRARRQSTRTS